MMIPKEAKICPHCRKKQGMSIIAAIFFVVVLFFAFGIIISLVMGPSGGKKASVSAGQNGILKSSGELTPVALTEKNFDAWTSAQVAKDNLGIQQLLASGKVVGVKSGTKVLVIEQATFKRKVRILEGKDKGLSGWVAMEYVTN